MFPTRNFPSDLFRIGLAFDTDDAGVKATAKAGLLLVEFFHKWGVPRSDDPRDIILAEAQRQFDIESSLDPESAEMEHVSEWLMMAWEMPRDPLMTTCTSAEEYEAAIAASLIIPEIRAGIDYKAIKEAIDIVEFIGRFGPIRRSGGGFKAMCPLHEDRHPSMHIYAKQSRWWCFVCNDGGDVIDYERARTRNDRAIPA